MWSGTADPDDGSLATPADLLPYGTYEVRETEPATGYLPDEAWSFTFEVREDGKAYSPGEVLPIGCGVLSLVFTVQLIHISQRMDGNASMPGPQGPLQQHAHLRDADGA